MSEYSAGSRPPDTAPIVSLNPRDPGFFQNPYAHYANWHDANTVFFWDSYEIWCLCRFSDVDQLLRDKRFGRQILHRYSRQQLGWNEPESHLSDFTDLEAHSLLNLEPPEHSRLRRHVNLQFAHRRVNDMRPQMAALADGILRDLLLKSSARGSEDATSVSANTIDLLSDFAAPFAATVITRLLGVSAEAIPDLLAWSHAMVKVYTCTQTHNEDLQANQAAIEFKEFLLHNIRKKRAEPSNDLLSELVAEQSTDAEAALTDDEIISLVVLMLNAGHEATVHQVGNAVKTLMEFQSGADGSRTDSGASGVSNLLSEEKQAKNTVTELMRLDTPLHMFTRYALEPLNLHCDDGTILNFKAGDQIGLLLGAANHDPLMFASPGQFNPERDPLDSLSLGAGIHFCLGAALAQAEIEIALRALFCSDYTIKVARQINYEYADSYHFRGLKQLPVSIQSKLI